MRQLNITKFRQKGGLLEKLPPTLSKLLVLNPPLCLNYPPTCLTENRGKNRLKLYKLYYKSEKPFIIKAFLLLGILETTLGRLRASRFCTGNSSPNE